MMVLQCTIPFEIMAEQKITIWFFICHLITPCFVYSLAAEEGNKGYGPVFEEQPIDTIYPEESSDGQVSMNCRARAVPFPTYRAVIKNVSAMLLKT